MVQKQKAYNTTLTILNDELKYIITIIYFHIFVETVRKTKGGASTTNKEIDRFLKGWLKKKGDQEKEEGSAEIQSEKKCLSSHPKSTSSRHRRSYSKLPKMDRSDPNCRHRRSYRSLPKLDSSFCHQSLSNAHNPSNQHVDPSQRRYLHHLSNSSRCNH